VFVTRQTEKFNFFIIHTCKSVFTVFTVFGIYKIIFQKYGLVISQAETNFVPSVNHAM